jgi:hypothetical protein
LIRTLLIRLFSMCAAKTPLVAHSYLMALAAFKSPLVMRVASQDAALLTPRPLCQAYLLQFHFRFHRR